MNTIKNYKKNGAEPAPAHLWMIMFDILKSWLQILRDHYWTEPFERQIRPDEEECFAPCNETSLHERMRRRKAMKFAPAKKIDEI